MTTEVKATHDSVLTLVSRILPDLSLDNIAAALSQDRRWAGVAPIGPQSIKSVAGNWCGGGLNRVASNDGRANLSLNCTG